MATLRQFTEGFYSSGQQKRPRLQLECLFGDLLEDLERQITVKLFDANRTLTSLTAEHRRTIDLDHIHAQVFEAGLRGKMKGNPRSINLLSSLVEVLPSHSIVRRHPRGDFCVIAPVMVCSHTIKEESFDALPVSASTSSTPHFSCEKGELFVPLRAASFSERLIEVISPYPGPGPDIVTEHYRTTDLPIGNGNDRLTFPPATDDEGIELVGVQKGDVGAAAKPGTLKVGDMLFCRGQQLKVKGVTGGGTKHEVYEGRDLIAFDSPFHFNSRKVHAYVCPPVLVKAKRGYLPRSVLQDYEPVTLKFTEHKQAKRFGNLKISFCSLAFNKNLVCHDSYV